MDRTAYCRRFISGPCSAVYVFIVFSVCVCVSGWVVGVHLVLGSVRQYYERVGGLRVSCMRDGVDHIFFVL